MNKVILDRDDMSEFERGLFLKDLQRLTDEYFERNDDASIDVTRTEEGFLVCVIFSARRIKTVKKPI